jgi:hypothetical protein
MGKRRSYHQLLQQFNFKSGHIILEVHGIGICQGKDGEDDEESLAVLSLSTLTKSHLFLVSSDFESIPIVLMNIPTIIGDESIEGIDEPALTARISKVKSLQIADKRIRSKDLQGCDLATIILNTSRIELITSRMRDHFLPPR